ncbi:mitochondrial acetyl-CoA acetyltransferase B [Drechslerella stenobrocha 248]|uniref:acetyl-CoA C-acetyltransferase n=1 Tax=Drechslerella stenobrocha 248 TaxID=1043628 RepID=W7HPP1_9PEZI|nr:mitochondrial acetyl-CoA acetyltransferase B [Drechslerella stenobrocha 248]
MCCRTLKRAAKRRPLIGSVQAKRTSARHGYAQSGLRDMMRPRGFRAVSKLGASWNVTAEYLQHVTVGCRRPPPQNLSDGHASAQPPATGLVDALNFSSASIESHRHSITTASSNASQMYRPTAPARARLAQLSRQFHASTPRPVRDAYILSAVRTPTGKFHGSLKSVPAPTLAATAIKEAVARSKVPPAKITHAYLGNVLQAAIGQAPARQAVLFAGLPLDVEATTVNKVCASGLKSVILAAQDVQLGLSEATIAGGMENMSLVPRYMERTVGGYGDVKAEDGILKDGLTDVYNKFHMGNCGENTAKKLSITREEQDAYAIESYRRAQAAWNANAFADEIVPVQVPQRKGDPITVSRDEDYSDVKLEKIPTLRSVFQKDGTITAANASTLNDGASAVIVGSEAALEEFGGDSRVAAKIVAYADASVDPIDFPLAPAKAIPIALERAGITKDDVAVWELNEAFAVVSKALEKTLELDPAKVNPKGGAISLGHALGSSGSRILTTLLYQLKAGEYGVAAICNGGGGATAMVVKKL